MAKSPVAVTVFRHRVGLREFLTMCREYTVTATGDGALKLSSHMYYVHLGGREPEVMVGNVCLSDRLLWFPASSVQKRGPHIWKCLFTWTEMVRGETSICQPEHWVLTYTGLPLHLMDS